jgi:hypothetical protein
MSISRCRKLLLPLVLFFGLICLGVEATSDKKPLNRTIERVSICCLQLVQAEGGYRPCYLDLEVAQNLAVSGS